MPSPLRSLLICAALSLTCNPSRSTRGASRPDAAANPLIVDASPDVVAPRAAIVPVQGSIPFAMMGRQGMLPRDVKPDEIHKLVAIVTFPGKGGDRVHVTLFQIEQEDVVVAKMSRLVSTERFPFDAPLTLARVRDSHGMGFDEQIEPGPVRLRVEAWLSAKPNKPFPLTVHVELEGDGVKVIARGPLTGEWGH